MAENGSGTIAKLVTENESVILPEWIAVIKTTGMLQTGRITEAELATECGNFLRLLPDAMARGGTDVAGSAYASAIDFLTNISRSRALRGFSPSETATFVFSLKEPLFNVLNRAKGIDSAALARMTWTLTQLLDKLGLLTLEVFQKSREEVILRQQREITELSTPVIKLWDGVLALPVIGTLDSERTQLMMENLLERIVEDGAEIAIIDITGVPTVDTLTAQHLLKTVAAARLMGADCIISGIRPQIAQTIVHLGVELNVTSKATLADALSIALRRVGRAVVKLKPGETELKKPKSDEKGE